jgi:hypothetical protein
MSSRLRNPVSSSVTTSVTSSVRNRTRLEPAPATRSPACTRRE